MLSQLFYLTVLLLSVTFKTSESACMVKPNSAIITALFPLHSGNDCSTVELRGLQQAAALQATVNTLNVDLKKERNIVINLKIEDTCSNEDGAVKAALKSMVDSDQTCLHPPLFMGFIGPEDKKVLEAVHQVTKLFNATHVVPYNLEAPVDTANEAILHVTAKQPEVQAEAIIKVLRQLEWTTFSIAIDDSPTNQVLAQNILEHIHGDTSLCVINNVAQITDTASISGALAGSTGHGILVLADSAKIAIDVLQINKILATPMVIYINKVGLQSWQVPSFNSTLIILQETVSEPLDGIAEAINASMYATYLKQQDQLFREINCKGTADASACTQSAEQDVFQGVLDPSLISLNYAVRLMASNLLVAHKGKCRTAGSEAVAPGLCSKLSRLPQGDWRNLLQRSTAVVKNGNFPTRIHFQMKITDAVDIFVRNQITLGLEKIGQITNGDDIKLLNGFSFPTTTGYNKNIKHSCPNDAKLQPLPTILTSSGKATPAVLLKPAEGHEEGEFYEMVTLLCGAGLGIFVFFVIMIYIVYSSFKVKTEKQSSGGSPTFQRKSSRIARWRRGSGQSSRASIRTID